MSDPDDVPAPPPSTPVLLARILLGPVLRLALAVSALLAIACGGERILRGAGYLVAGLLVWLELARAGRRGAAEEES